jgi:AcrR family transcriptional regulator
MASVDQVVRMALTKVPMHTPATPGRAARRRRDPGKSTPQPQPLDDLGAALVLSAAEVFAEDGYDVATVAEIARQAGVTTGAIYNRFSGKGGLLAEVVSQVSAPRAMADLATVADALTSGSAAAAGKAIGALVERAREPEHVRDNALRLEARHAARLEPEVDEVVRPLQDHALATLSAEIRRAQSAGALRLDVDAEALAWWFAGLPLGIALLEDELPPSIDWSPTFAAVIRALRTNPT